MTADSEAGNWRVASSTAPRGAGAARAGDDAAAAELEGASGFLQAGEDGLLAALGAKDTGSQHNEGEDGGYHDEGDEDDGGLKAGDPTLVAVAAAHVAEQSLHLTGPPPSL